MNASTVENPLRLWPGVVALVLQWLGWLIVPMFWPEAMLYGVLGGLACGPVIVLWWLFFSRAPWSERLGALAVLVIAIAVTQVMLHESVAKGNLGFQFYLNVIPLLSLTFISWAVVSRYLSTGIRWFSMVVTILVTCGFFTLIRSEGLSGDGFPEFTWRWGVSAEERLLAQADDEFAAPPSTTAAPKKAEWPGFRGPDRAGLIRDLRIETNWSVSPPVELWRRPVGPGVSSFAVGGDFLYTQEQRGDHEVVSCYQLTTGQTVWRHLSTNRFWDSHVGAGPRATPALGDGRVYALGATGTLNALDALDGSVVWSRNAAADTDAKVPGFGFVNSPLVVDDSVIVHTKATVAYDLATGDPRWSGPDRGFSYSSPHLMTIDGVGQVLMLVGGSLISLEPTDGRLLWDYRLPEGLGGIVQPALTRDGDVLISSQVSASASPADTRRIEVTQGPDGWTIGERWVSNGLKPSFSQIVVYEDHAYGFDGRILASIALDDGKRRWKGGRYGSGQLMLLADQSLLLVVSEKGDVALVEASPDRFHELARFKAIEGKTWSQPALVGNTLLVRNGQEMAAFVLPLAIDTVSR